MIINNAEVATEQARRIVGYPPKLLFKPIEGKKENGHWIVKAIVGVLDNILVTVEMPERLLDV